MTGIEGPHPFAFLATWRENAGLTQAQVAAHFGVSDVTVHRWETGKAPITVQNFVLLAKLFCADNPGRLLFPPEAVKRASIFQNVDSIIATISPDDLKRWMEIGESLAAKNRPDESGADAA